MDPRKSAKKVEDSSARLLVGDAALSQLSFSFVHLGRKMRLDMNWRAVFEELRTVIRGEVPSKMASRFGADKIRSDRIFLLGCPNRLSCHLLPPPP